MLLLTLTDKSAGEQGTRTPVTWQMDPGILPRVSVVIPLYNEADHIEGCLNAVLSQDYPRDKLEIHVVDGNSEDGSADLVRERFVDRGEPVVLHDNPQRKTARALNIGLRAATGEVVIILGAHTEINPYFIHRNIKNLRQPGVACSGGTQINVGQTAKQASIGAAMSHPFGMATAPYRYQQRPGVMNTVVYGAYRREIFEKVGYFEEVGTIAEDADLNWRIVQAGYTIYYDPQIKTRYYPRSKFLDLARQLYRYGIMRAYMFRKHFEGLSLLHFVPPILIFSLSALAIGAAFGGLARLLLAGLVLVYTGLALGFGIVTWRSQREAHPAGITWAFITMHLAWGTGFLVGLLSPKTYFKEYVH